MTLTITDAEPDTSAADEVTKKINAIGEVTLESEAAILEARAAYDALEEEQKNYVTEETLKVLTDAESRLTELKEAEAQKKADQEAAAAVTEQINAIGEVTLESEAVIQAARAAYEGLTEAQREYVTEETLKALTDAENVLAQLKKEASDKELAKAVEAAIAEIGEVTLEKENLIVAIRANYDALTEEQKAYIEEES